VYRSEFKKLQNENYFILIFNRSTEMLGAITRQISRLSICSLRLKPGSALTRAPTVLRSSGLTNPLTQQARLFSIAGKQTNQKLISQVLARPIIFRHYTTEGKSI
jgi:hypothetical protein